MDKLLKVMEDQLAQLDAAKIEIAKRAVDEDRALTDADSKAIADIDAKKKAIEDKYAVMRSAVDSQNARRRTMPTIANPDAVTPDAAVALEGRSADGPTTVRERWVDDPKKGFKSPRHYLMAVMNASTGRVVAQADAEKLRFLRTQSQGFQATVGSDEQSGASDPHGGFLVPMGFSPDLLSIRSAMDPVAPLVRAVPMQTPSLALPVRADKNHSSSVSGGLTVTRRPETVAATASRMSFEQVRLTANNLFGLAYTSDEVLTDSPISFIALLEQGFSDEFASKLMYERLRGTGVGEFLGVINAACTVSIAKETGQAGATIVKENVDKMQAQCWAYHAAVWLANQSTVPQLKSLSQVVGTGGSPVSYYSEMPAGVDANGMPKTQAMLNGRPLFFTEHCSTLGTVGDLVLGVWSEYLEGTYQPLQSAESIHVRFVNHERAFKFWLRNDGRPWWSTYITPVNGNSLAPFLTLATRA